MKEHFKNNSQLLIGDYEGDYIVMPDPSYMLLVPSSQF